MWRGWSSWAIGRQEIRDQLQEKELSATKHWAEMHCGRVFFELADLVPILQARRERKISQWEAAVRCDLGRLVGAPLRRWQVWAEQRATGKV